MLCSCGNHGWKPLTKGFVTLVSPEDNHLLDDLNWYIAVDGKGYPTVRRNLPRVSGKRPQQKLSRAVANPDDGQVVDHIDGNPLNNQRNNLRCCLPSENVINAKPRRGKTVSLKGVRLAGGAFQSVITRDGRQHCLGTYQTAEEAHAAYRGAATILHGKFARLS